MTWEPDLIRSAGEAFHVHIAGLEKPAFLDLRTDAWSTGDRVAWEGRLASGGEPTRDQIERLRAALEPVSSPSQVIHGDLGGNVLLTEGGPAVIDWPPYYRPAGFALAVAAADAVRWEDVPVSFLDAWAEVADWHQLLARALIYRLATTGVQQLQGSASLSSADHAAVSEPAVSHVLRRLTS